MAGEDQAASQEENLPAIRADKIYLKDVSFETPNSPLIFTLEWKPTLNFDFGHKVATLSEDMYEVVLELTATTTIDDKTAYLAEIHQSGIFMIQSEEQEQVDRLLNVYCSRILYPYACAAMSDLVTKGGFPQLLLAPVNFDALYKQRLQGTKEQADAMQAQETESS